MTSRPRDLSTVAITDDLVHGVVELERTARGLAPHRLPAWARAQCPDPQLLMAEGQPSGVRLVLRTRATVLELDTVPTKRVYSGLPARPDGVYDLIVDGAVAGRGTAVGGDVLTIDMTNGSTSMAAGEVVTVRFDGLDPRDKDVEIWLPHDETTLLVSLRSDAPAAAVPSTGPRWVHHGSSISQGSNADRPTGTWPAVAASLAGANLVNLGYGGSALLDPFVARMLRDSEADVISLELGVNVVNHDLMRRRAFASAVHGYLDTIRDGHPITPIVLVSPVLCPMHEEVPGPTMPDPAAFAQGRAGFVAAGDPAEVATGKLTLRVVREELERVVEQRNDPHLTCLDGRELYGESDAVDLPLPDGLHPDPATHRVIGERFARLVLQSFS